MKLSVVLATYNEEKNISECINSFKDIADEIIVFDESSVDKTRDIAQNLGAEVFKVEHQALFHITKQKAIDKASGEWILQMDADERITLELSKEIAKIVNDSDIKYSAYYIKRKNYFIGKWMKGSGMWPDSVIRLFKKGKALLPQKTVHEQMEVEGKAGTLENPMDHFTAPTFSKYLVNANRYTTLTALEFQKMNLKVNVFSFINYAFFKPFSTFLLLFLRHKGFRDGLYGFVFDLFSGLHFPIAFIKYMQLVADPEKKENFVNWK